MTVELMAGAVIVIAGGLILAAVPIVIALGPVKEFGRTPGSRRCETDSATEGADNNA